MKRIYLLLTIGLFLSSASLSAQENDYDYGSEFLWGINKNTSGGLIGGVMFRYSKRINENVFQNFGLELLNVKNRNELRRQSRFNNPFIWCKVNYLYSVRTYYGREWVLFKKAPQQGVQLSANLAAGPTFGLVVPYYIQFQENNYVERVPFDPEIHGNFIGRIVGAGGLFQGLGQASIQPGINVKASLSFEFGTFKSNVTGFEAGFAAEAFTKDIELMAFVENQSTFFTAFITLFYGSRQ